MGLKLKTLKGCAESSDQYRFKEQVNLVQNGSKEAGHNFILLNAVSKIDSLSISVKISEDGLD